MKITLTILLISTYGLLNANDGAFYMSGNHLIPVNETQVELRKEILTVKRVGSNILIDVDYTFYNPGKAKKVLMGFEAPMPRGAAEFQYDIWKITRNHPYLKNFTVEINGFRIPYKADIVNKQAYETIGSLAGFPQSEIDELNEIKSDSARHFYRNYSSQNRNNESHQGYHKFLSQFIYVNYFDASFQSGTNKVHHSYTFPISGSIDVPLNFQYILTAANRWANGQIDDFTLIIDMGNFRDYYINQTFFKGLENWNKSALLQITNPKALDEKEQGFHIGAGHDNGSLKVRTKEAPIVYKQKNFSPKGELDIWGYYDEYGSLDGYIEYNGVFSDTGVFDVNKHVIYYSFHHYKNDLKFAADEFTLKVLRNYPFAVRGYAFKNRKLRNYYLGYSWYQPDESLNITAKDIPYSDLKWIQGLSVFKNKDN